MEFLTKERRQARVKYYKTGIWQRIRRKQLSKHPLCEHCLKQNNIEKASICDHINAEWVTWSEFCRGPFQSLCRACHDLKTQFIDKPRLLKAKKTAIISQDF